MGHSSQTAATQQKGTVKRVSNHDGHLMYEREGSGHLMSSTEKLALVETRLKTRASRLSQFDLNLKDLLFFNYMSEIIKEIKRYWNIYHDRDCITNN